MDSTTSMNHSHHASVSNAAQSSALSDVLNVPSSIIDITPSEVNAFQTHSSLPSCLTDSFTQYRNSRLCLISDVESVSDSESSEAMSSDSETSDETIVGGLQLENAVSGKQMYINNFIAENNVKVLAS